MSRWFWIVRVVTTACLLWATGTAAQVRGDPMSLPGQPGTPTTYGAKGLILLTVFGRNHTRLERQALVKISNRTTHDIQWQTTQSQSEASIGDLPAGTYELEVSAVGYVPAHKEVAVASMMTSYRVEIELAPDPDAVDLQAAISTAQFPPKARKETNRALMALKSGRLKDAEKRLNSAYRLLPGSTDVNFLMGYLFLEKGDLKQATTYLGSAASMDPRNFQALTLLGRLQLKQQEYTTAETTLEHAVALNADSSIAHGLLAEAYLKAREYEKARLQAQLSVDKSKDAGNTAHIVLGEVLANLGHDEEAIQSLKTFLKYSPDSPPSRQVRDLITFLEDRVTDLTKQAQPLPGVDSHLVTSESLDSEELRLSIKTWQPPGINDRGPTVAVGVSCPYEDVIHQAGFRVEELVDNVARFQAIEDLLHEDLDELGHTVAKDTRQFDYLVEMSEQSSGEVAVKEYRTGHSGTADFPDKIATRGLPALALIFHPHMQDSFQMSCEGLGEWEGQATWLVNFRQREDKPNRIRAYKINSSLYPVGLKGRAWISAKTFELVHLESELTNPVREIQLLSEHAFVNYGPVLFPKKQVELWLPKNAELYFDFRHHRYHRRHSFDHFMLFSVDSEEKRKEPKAKPQPPVAGSHASPRP